MANNTDYTRLLDGHALLAIKAWVEAKGYGTVKSIKVGNTSYSPSSGVVSLPAYPTTLPANGGNSDTVDGYHAEQLLVYANYKYHDIAAFCNASTPLYEVSADGSTGWAEATLNKDIFAAKENYSFQVTNTSQKGARFTWKGGISWSSICYSIIGWTYQATPATVTLKFESSADSGSTWTDRRTITDITANAQSVLYSFSNPNGDKWFRVSIIQTSSTGSKNISTIKLLTARWGDQGLGSEYEKPYVSDGDKTVRPWANNTQLLGTSSYKWKEIHGITIYENGTTLTNKYLGKTAKAADSDKLDGQDSTYYLNYNNLSNKPTIPSVSNATITIKQTGISDQTFTLNGSATTITLADTNTWRPLGTGANDACAGNDSRLSNARPASDVYSWAKASTKPTYTYSEVGAAAAGHNHDDVYIKYSVAQTLTDAQKTQARSNIGAGTSSFTGYTSSNKLSTNYIQNDAGWTSVTESTVSGWGFTKNAGTITSVGAGTGLSISGTASVNPTVNIASGYKLPTTSEWNLAYSKPIIMLEDNSTATAGTWLAKTSLISALADGQLFLYKLTKAGASTTTLNVSCNGTASGAKTVYRVGTTKLTTHYGVGSYILLYYNGTNFYCINDYDANSYAYLRQYQSGNNEAGSGTLYPILTRYNLTNKHDSYDTAYARYHTETYIDTSNGYLYAPKVYSGGSEVLTGITSAMVTTALGYTPGTSNFTGYTSSNKLHTDYINNAAGWTSNTGTITGVSVNGSSVATSGVANITSIPYSILTNPPTIPATNVIPATTSKHAMLLSTQTSGTAEWSSWSDAGVIASTTSGEVVLLSKGSANQGKFLGISSNNTLGWTSLPEANTTTAGIVTTDEQSFAGVKTFRLAPFIGYKKSGSTSGISGAINFVDGTTTYPYRTILRVTEGLTATSNIVYLPTGTGILALVGDNNHSHTLSIASGGSSPTTLAANTTYTLTAGGSTLVFKTPSASASSAYYANQYNYNYFLDSASGAFLFSAPIESQTTIVGLQGGNAIGVAIGWPGLAANLSKKSLYFIGNRVDLVLTDQFQYYIKGLAIDMYDDDYYTLHIRANAYSDMYGTVNNENTENISVHANAFYIEPSNANSAVSNRRYVSLGVVMHNITYTFSSSVLLKINIRDNSALNGAITSYTGLCSLLYTAGHRSSDTCLVCSGRYSSYSYVVLGVYATASTSGLYLVYCTTSNNTVSTLAISNGTITDKLSVSLVP